MKPDRFYVYVLFRPDNGQPFYVGKGQNHRWIVHFCPSRMGFTHKDNLIRKFLAEGLNIPRVKIASGLTEDRAFALEAAFIAAIGREPAGPLLNVTDGGGGASGRKRTDEHTEALMRAVRGSQWSDSARKNHVQAMLGRKRNPESVAKMAETKRGKPLSAEHRASIAEGLRGRVLSQKSRDKISQAHKGHKRGLGRVHSEETRLKISASKKGKLRTDEQKIRISQGMFAANAKKKANKINAQ